MIESRIRVRYSETDQMGIAYHANHLVWFEVGRSEFCRAAGVPYTRMEESGFSLVVAEVGCRYLRPARYDQEVVVRTRLKDLHRRSVRFEYELAEENGGEVLARGHTRHLVLDRDGRPASMPAEWVEALRRLSDP